MEEELSSASIVEDRMFIDDSVQEEQENRSFSRDLDNRENYSHIINQTRNPVEAFNEHEEEYYREDNKPELYDPENRDEVNFDSFDTDHDKAMHFNSLVCFPNVDNHFFYAAIYGIMHNKLKGENIELVNARETLGDYFF